MVAERFTGRVEQGKVIFDQPGRWRGAVARLSGKRIEVSLQRLRQVRSLKANAYLWRGVYYYLADWSGHDDQEIHAAMKEMFCPQKDLLLPTGEVVPVRSTRLLDETEFSDFVAKVKRWSAEQGVLIPEPDEVGDL